MKQLYILAIALLTTIGLSAQTILYSNDFENDTGDATIVGNGAIVEEETAGFGSVFHNAAGGQAIRSNYLLLPDNIFAQLQESGSKELSIAFWVNKGTAVDQLWTPIFSAYGAAPVNNANTWPMMVLQSRLVGQVNNSGWTDLTDAQNTNGTNTVDVEWLDDEAWHFYTATFTESEVKVYIDGEVKNTWTLSGDENGSSVSGLFNNGSALTYICLGGNQAWDWADPDPAYKFDDLAIYSSLLNADQIEAIIAAKSGTAVNQFDFSGEVVKEEFFSITGAKAGNDFKRLQRGIYIKKSTFSNGAVNSSKIVKMQ
ncbi:LamG-like jellyroll fold domain-containing protein [Roseimarinus sediminis]|uniref:LamG-like jellyroll fold domain-containing protein n=1 Tax=Roseimarinus sediminis TaxID=1610899 RepID=UPI003D25BB44